MHENDRGRELDQTLAVYQRLSDRYQSHITIMWQAPALGLAAEAFLLTVSLDSALSKTARVIAAILGALVALMSMQLMAKHRSISRRDDDALQLLEKKLGISSPWEEVEPSGGPWAVKTSSYLLWQIGLLLFVLTNLGLVTLLAISAKV